MSAQTCAICGADPRTVGVVDGHLCFECLHREGIEMTALADRDFGVGIPGIIADECYRLRDLVQARALEHGNPLAPIKVFSDADAETRVRVRLDDKLTFLAAGDSSAEIDLLVCLVMLRVARRLKESPA